MRAPQPVPQAEAWRDLPAVLSREYGVRVEGLVRMRTVIGVVLTDGRRWIWKWARSVDNEDRLADVARAAATLQQAGIEAAGPIAARDGRYLTQVADRPGYVQPWLSGRHVNGAQPREQASALAVIGQMHTVLRLLARDCRVVPDAWPLRRKLAAKRAMLKASLPRAAAALPEIAHEAGHWQRHADAVWCAFVADGGAWSAYEMRRTFCHRDLALHNLLWQGPGRIAIIDFDLAAPDDPLGDVFQLIHHFVYTQVPREGDIRAWVDAYLCAAGLTDGDARRLWGLLAFPDLVIRAVSDWVRAGCPTATAVRVLAAFRAEAAKQRVLRNDTATGLGP